MTTCPNCGGESTAINDEDQALCCTGCGTVIEDLVLRMDYTESNNHVEIVKPDTASDKTIKEWLNVLGRMLKIGDAAIEEAQHLLLTHSRVALPIQRPKEIAISLLFVCGRSGSRPTWTMDDYLCPLPILIDRKQVHRICNSLFQVVRHWASPPAKQLPLVMDKIFPVILKQTKKEPKKIRRKDVHDMALRLIELASYYCIDAGKTPRPFTAAAILMCAFYFVRKQNIQYVKKAGALHIPAHNRYWHWDDFASILNCSRITIRDRYADIGHLLYQCTRNMPWIKDCRAHAYVYLEDILQLYTSERLTLTLEQQESMLPTVVQSKEEHEFILSYINAAKRYGSAPPDPNVYATWRLLQSGYSEEDIKQWHVYQIVELCAALDFRETTGTSPPSALDTAEVTERDMSNQEVEVYMQIPHQNDT